MLRAIRFAHPDLDDLSAHQGSGLGLSPTGRLDTIDGSAAVRQALLLLLTTIPGERVMRSNYGCELYRLLFAPNDETTAGLAIHYVRRAVERWEPRVEILAVNAARSPDDPGRLDVSLEYRALRGARVERLSLPLFLDGERR